MKKIYLKLIVLLALIYYLTACTKDFLEVDQRGLTSQDNYYKTDDEALAAVVSAYDILQSLWAEDWQSLWMVKELPAHEITSGIKGDQSNYDDLVNYKYTSENVPVGAVYKNLYYGIYRANKVIEKVEPNTEAKKIIIAEAKCLRSYYYFELVTLFGASPLVTKELTPDEYGQPPSTVADIWAQIEKDLKEAIPDMILKSELISKYGATHAFRVNKGTAQALLGKAYLYQEKYTDAVTQFEAVIALEGTEYDLETSFSRILRKDTEFGIESLFEISYSTEEGHTWANGTFPWGNGRGQENNIHWQLCGPRFEWFNGGTSGLLGGWGFAYPTKEIYDVFASNDTVRRKASIMSEAEVIAFGGSMRDTDGKLYAADTNGLVRLKYGTWADETDITTQPELNYGTNIRLIRYADVLLMAAEAYHKSGDDNAALVELNKVRSRVNLPAETATGTALFDAIVYERQVELAFEGHRFTDLVRWNLADDVLGTYGYKEHHATYPIPQAALDVNKNLKPTPGY